MAAVLVFSASWFHLHQKGESVDKHRGKGESETQKRLSLQPPKSTDYAWAQGPRVHRCTPQEHSFLVALFVLSFVLGNIGDWARALHILSNHYYDLQPHRSFLCQDRSLYVVQPSLELTLMPKLSFNLGLPASRQ